MGKEENQSKLQRERGDNGSVLTLIPYEDITWYITASDWGGRHQGRRAKDLQGVITADFEVSEVPGGGMSGKGKKSRKTEGEFNVLTLEVKGGNHAGGEGTVTAV